jgi:hypothetical protein
VLPCVDECLPHAPLANGTQNGRGLNKVWSGTDNMENMVH